LHEATPVPDEQAATIAIVQVATCIVPASHDETVRQSQRLASIDRQHFCDAVGAGHSETAIPPVIVMLTLNATPQEQYASVESDLQTYELHEHRPPSSQQLPCSPAFFATDDGRQASPVAGPSTHRQPPGVALHWREPMAPPAPAPPAPAVPPSAPPAALPPEPPPAPVAPPPAPPAALPPEPPPAPESTFPDVGESHPAPPATTATTAAAQTQKQTRATMPCLGMARE
jgi:hypothetical protein